MSFYNRCTWRMDAKCRCCWGQSDLQKGVNLSLSCWIFAASEPCFCAKTRVLYSHLRRCGGYHIMTHHDQKKSQPGWQKTLVPAESEENLFLVLKLNSSCPLSCHVVQANVSRYNHHPGWPCKVEFFRNNTGTPWKFSILNSIMEVWFKMIFLFQPGVIFRYFVFKCSMLQLCFFCVCVCVWVGGSLAPSCSGNLTSASEGVNLFNLLLSASVLQQHALHAWKLVLVKLRWTPDVSVQWSRVNHSCCWSVCFKKRFSGSGLFSSSKCFRYLGWCTGMCSKLRNLLIFVAIIKNCWGNTLILPHIQCLIWFLHLLSSEVVTHSS